MIKLDPMLLTPGDMRRARAMLAEQGDGEEPYDLLDAQDDVTREKRRVLLYWCFRSREDASFTWEQAWETPFAVLLEAEVDEEDVKGPPSPGNESGGSEPGMNGSGSSKRKRPATASASSTG